MRLGKLRRSTAGCLVAALFSGAVFSMLATSPVFAGERQFLVILATSPKQYPNPDREPAGIPTGGLINRQLIQSAYFDRINPDLGSFAEYWEEISYGDVRISGTVTDWVSLPWAIQPPLLDPEGDELGGDPPIWDLAVSDMHNSPSSYYDLNNDLIFEYGTGERFDNTFSASIIDLDGDPGPGGSDNGPFFASRGSDHMTSADDPVYKPGERFIDMDDDGRWDGLDEANNEMDWNGDGRPDLLGPWIDLDGDGAANNATDCIYHRDQDNDGNPDCCPDGPSSDGCDGNCPPAKWAGPSGEILDCNGNLIPDACDISAFSTECRATGYLDDHEDCDNCGESRDDQPFEPDGGQCGAGPGDGIPDECQFVNFLESCTNDRGAIDAQPPHPCAGNNLCIPRLDLDPGQLPDRCEYDDVNGNNQMDIVEPFENFIRRWDPCVFDPDASTVNRFEQRAHWVKVYDPQSPNAFVENQCLSPERSFSYGDDSYIIDNYPGTALRCSKSRTKCETDDDCGGGGIRHCEYTGLTCSSDSSCGLCRFNSCLGTGESCQSNADCSGPCVNDEVCWTGAEELAAEAGVRILWGWHDEEGYASSCVCADGSDCVAVGAGGNRIGMACVAGIHAEYNPPDSWFDVVAFNGPDQTEVYTTKMQIVGGNIPGAPETVVNKFTFKPTWYDDAWEDRYNGVDGCSNPDFDPHKPVDALNNNPSVWCEAPPWPGGTDEDTGVSGPWAIPLVVPFRDVDPEIYEPDTHRRYFSANFGGTTSMPLPRAGAEPVVIRVGRGVGWIGCDQSSDPAIIFETFADDEEPPVAFEGVCNNPILPEEVEGEDDAAIFFDGWVEHDDLPSSKYHHGGDQRLGEITSPFLDVTEYRPDELEPEDDSVVIHQIWGEDRSNGSSGSTPDQIIPAAGPYATHIHGNNGRDAGNVLSMELLTWRTRPPFSDGEAWENDVNVLPNAKSRSHPYAGPSGAYLGFRDFNLDGLIDQGETRFPGSENYFVDSYEGTSDDGTNSVYPFNRARLIEDCIEVLDFQWDFDDFVDPVTMEQRNCVGGSVGANLPVQYETDPEAVNPTRITPAGVISGVVLLPRGSNWDTPYRAPTYLPIHNEDGSDPRMLFPTDDPKLSWNLFFHNLVVDFTDIDDIGSPVRTGGFQSAVVAHEYLHTWEDFKDVYDADRNITTFPRPQENCPIGNWGIMATGNMVHPIPIFKHSTCTEWIDPIDLRTILTPGVDTTLTLPPAELVRDNSYYFLENENFVGERFYFWSAGSGFDSRMPGAGLLIMHTDNCANPEGCTQQTSPPFTYEIIQADGRGDLTDCTNRGDLGDPWPGTSGSTRFDFDSIPASRWTSQNSWTGLDITDIIPDGQGSVQLKLNWSPTNIPSLRFTTPPRGVSVRNANTGDVKFAVGFRATDVFGGTTISMYYTEDVKACSVSGESCSRTADCLSGEVCVHDLTIQPGDANLIASVRKTTPGTNELSMDWLIRDGRSGVAVPDGRYVLFAELMPGVGADQNMEDAHTDPRAGRNNSGDGFLHVYFVNIGGHAARSESWTAVCIDANSGEWQVNSTLTQPAVDDDSSDPDPYPHAFTDVRYTSVGGEVQFTIVDGSEPFALGDTFTFTTTGLTAVSSRVTIAGGQISEDPVAIIDASPLAGDPPLTVSFDARRSVEPNGEPLSFRWNFGDGSGEATGATARHVFVDAGTFTVTLTAINPRNGRFGETAVDIDVTNNSPRAVIKANPTSGLAPLTVQFSGAQSSDMETEIAGLTYHWDWGDGESANDALNVGVAFQSVMHFYSRAADGTPCTSSSPCEFVATLTVFDGGGKQDTDSINIRVGNTDPVANVTHSALQGSDPWQVVFNAINSSDADGDALMVEWIWGDGKPNQEFPLTGEPDATDGSVRHTFDLPPDTTFWEFHPTAIVRDGRGGEAFWPGVTVIVTEAAAGSSTPQAVIRPRCDEIVVVLNEEFEIDGLLSFDRPSGSQIAAYIWDWDDGSDVFNGVSTSHTYTEAGTYRITLTVKDGEDPPNSHMAACTVIVAGSGGQVTPPSDNRAPIPIFSVNPQRGFAGSTVFSFDASASTDPDGEDSALTFEWSFGDGSRADGVSATHTYTAPNLAGYTVRLTVRDEKNASRSRVETVVVEDSEGNLPPHAFIAAGPRGGTAPLTLTFDGRNSFDENGDLLEYRWIFKLEGEPFDEVVGDGMVAAVVTQLFELHGDYTVELEVRDGRGGFSATLPEAIQVTARVSGPVDPPPGQDADGDPDEPVQAPLCGLGLFAGLFGTLLGLGATRVSRRRFRSQG